ncbi:hypothetical protein [Nostoc sp. CCY 9925]|uniref:hypothetical protein n=1 Tax=Nostoc sp. CCY 9925 TaxID=3103865 RepID=UPI0039C73BB2
MHQRLLFFLTFPVKSLLQAANPHKGRAILTNPSTVPEYQRLAHKSQNFSLPVQHDVTFDTQF